MPSETSLQRILLLRAPERLPELRLFRRNVVAVQVGGRGVRAGIAGQSDLYGYVRGGHVIEVEVKGVRTPVTPEQRAWAAWCEEWRIPHLMLRAKRGEAPDETVERWCQELDAVVRRLLSGA